MGISNTGFISEGFFGLCPDGRQLGERRDKPACCRGCPLSVFSVSKGVCLSGYANGNVNSCRDTKPLNGNGFYLLGSPLRKGA